MPAIVEFRSEPSGGVIFSKNGAFTQPFSMGAIQKRQPTYEDFFWRWLDNQATPDRYIGYFWLFNVGDTVMTSIKIRPTETTIPHPQLRVEYSEGVFSLVEGAMQLHQYSLKVQGTSGSGITEQANTSYQKNSVAMGPGILSPDFVGMFSSAEVTAPAKYGVAPTTTQKYAVPPNTLINGFDITYFQVDDIPPGCGRKISVQFHPLCLTSLESFNHGFTVEFN